MDFVIVGPEKCGTGWIDAALRRIAPHILPATLKETFYLDRHFHLGPEWHRSLFGPDAIIRGEVSPSYFASEEARKRLKEISPGCRIVVVLRNPYDRMVSHIIHLARRGAFDTSQGADRVPAGLLNEARNSSLYASFGEAWQSDFPHGQTLFVSYDDIQQQPAALLNRICQHIGIEERIDEATAHELSGRKVFEAKAPRNRLVTRAVYLASRKAQALGLTSLVTAIRNSPIRRLIEKPIGESDEFREQLRSLVRTGENFDTDIAFAERVLNARLSTWKV